MIRNKQKKSLFFIATHAHHGAAFLAQRTDKGELVTSNVREGKGVLYDL